MIYGRMVKRGEVKNTVQPLPVKIVNTEKRDDVTDVTGFISAK